MDRRAFEPCGKTINVDAATSAPSGITAPAAGVNGVTQYRIHNASTTIAAFVAFGVDASAAAANAVIPTGDGANSKLSFPLPPGAIEVITAPEGTYWSAITASSTAEIYVTPGRGL